METNIPKEEVSNNNAADTKQPDKTLMQCLAQLGEELNAEKLKNELTLATAPAKFSFYEKFIAARLAKIAHMACEHPKKFTVLSLVLRELLQTDGNDSKETKLEKITSKLSPNYPSDFVHQLTSVKKTALNTVFGKITCVVCSSDNKTLFIGDNDETIQIWSISNFLSPFLIKTFKNTLLTIQHCILNSLTLTTNNNTLFSSSPTHITIWDVSNLNNPTLITTFDQSINEQTCLTMSTDDKILLSGSSSSTIKIWDINDLKKPKLISTINESNNGHNGQIKYLTLTAGNKTLFAELWFQNTIIVWNIADPKRPQPLKKIIIPGNSYYAVAISTDAKTLFFTYEDGFRIMNISNPNKPKNIGRKIKDDSQISQINYLELSTDNKRLFVGSRANAIKIWNVSNPKKPILLDTKDTLSDAISMIKSSPNNRLLFYQGENKNLKIAHYPDLFVPTLADYLTQLPSSSHGILKYFFIKEIVNHKNQQIQKGSQHNNPLAITNPLLTTLFKALPRELKLEMVQKKYVTFTTPLYKQNDERAPVNQDSTL